MADRPKRHDPAEILAAIPDHPGVYIYRDPKGKPIYVGKAKSLRKRVSQYFHRPYVDPKTAALLDRFATIDTILTDNEIEALSLENALIKKHRPKYNVLLRDDKTYPYIKITTGEVWPRAFVTRRIEEDGHSYFGPFIPGGRARAVMKLLTRYFRIRTCRIEIDGRLPRPCLYWDMKACPGPCVTGLTTPEEYGAAVDETLLFLKGRDRELDEKIRGQMDRAAEREEFELAAHYRDLLRVLVRERQELKTETTGGENLDAFAIHEEQGDVALAVLVMREGRVIDRREMFWEKLTEAGRFDPSAFLAAIVPQYYASTDFVPDEVHLPAVPHELGSEEEGGTDLDVLSRWLTERVGRRVVVRVPERGEKRRRVELAEENARAAHKVRFRKPEEGKDPVARLRTALSLPGRPNRIEGFDVSHLQGSSSYTSMVVFEGGKSKKSDYRLFSMPAGRNDDFTSIAEAVTRRYGKVAADGGVLPDLVLIDGGRGQLGAAVGALAALGLELPVASLAKKEEEVYVPGRFHPIRLSRNDSGLRLLQQVRDEAHRFAISAHRRKRGKAALESALVGIPGLGPTRIRKLAEAFGDPRLAARATDERLVEILGEAAARRIAPELRARWGAASGGDAFGVEGAVKEDGEGEAPVRLLRVAEPGGSGTSEP